MQKIKLELSQIKQGSLILINTHHPFHECLERELYYVQKERLQKQAAIALMGILEKTDRILCVSGYRNREYQQQLYQSSLQEHGLEYTKRYVAMPGCSEHETGFAVDLGLTGKPIDLICPHFQNDAICEWFIQEATQHGFIQRYTKKDEKVTGIAYEPWHFRYVGYPHSTIMARYDWCLEDYHHILHEHDLYRPFIFVDNNHIFEIFYVQILQAQTICLKDDVSYCLSGNNIDGVIVTCRRQR